MVLYFKTIVSNLPSKISEKKILNDSDRPEMCYTWAKINSRMKSQSDRRSHEMHTTDTCEA